MATKKTTINPALLRSGTEVAIVDCRHPKHGAIGVTAGLSDTLGSIRIRIHIDSEIFLCDPTQLEEN